MVYAAWALNRSSWSMMTPKNLQDDVGLMMVSLMTIGGHGVRVVLPLFCGLGI